MKREEVIDQITDEISCPSNKFSFMYNVVEYTVNKIYDDFKKQTCENCKYCIEDNNDTDVWIECRKKDSPMEHNSLLTEKGYPNIINFNCSEWEEKS